MPDAAVVDLWVWSLDLPSDARRYPDLLSEEELGRAQRFVNRRDGDRFVVSRGRMREILANYLGAPAQGLIFSFNAQGKPSLGGAIGQVRFNLSHSDGLAALGVSHDFELGVDIERVRSVTEDIAGRFFAADEQAALAALPPSDQTRGFHLCWTRKEAFIKAVGEGLSVPLDKFSVSIDEADARLLHVDGSNGPLVEWRLHHFEPAPGFVGAVAARTGGPALTLRLRTSL